MIWLLGSAFADVVGTGSQTCPPGSLPYQNHYGQACVPEPCGADCVGTCREVGLCIGQATVGGPDAVASCEAQDECPQDTTCEIEDRCLAETLHTADTHDPPLPIDPAGASRACSCAGVAHRPALGLVFTGAAIGLLLVRRRGSDRERRDLP